MHDFGCRFQHSSPLISSYRLVRSEFKHDHFKKGKPKLLSKIKRVVSDLRKQALDSSLKPKKETRGTANDGADNNEDLRSDVAELRSQVEDLKNQVSGLLVVLTHLVPGFSPLTMTGVQPAGAPNEHKDREEDEQTSSGGKGGRRKPQSQSQKRTSKRLRTGEESHISLSPPTLPASSSSSAHDAVLGNGGKSHHTGERVSLEGLPLNHPLASRGGQTTSLDILKEAIGGGDQALSLQALQQQVSLPGSMISFGPMSGLSALGSLSMGFNSGGLEVLGNIAAVSSGTGSSSQRQSTRGTGTSSASSRAAATPELGARERAKQIEKRLEGVPLAKIRQPSSRGKK